MRQRVPHPATARELLRELRIAKEDRVAFKRTLRHLVSDGELIQIKGHRYGLPDRMDLVVGRLDGHPSGFGFVKPERPLDGTSRDIPSATADRAFATALYGAHPYGHLPIGTAEALAQMTAHDVRTLHHRAYRPSRTVLIVVGAASAAQVIDEVAGAFGNWTDPEDAGAVAPIVEAPPPPIDRLWLIDRPGAAQSELRIGHLGVSRRTPDYHALLVANLVLGGQFVSRLNMNLREGKGYTYGARSWFEFRLAPGPFQISASVQTEVTADAMREAISELSDLRGARPIGDGELETARATLTRGYPRNFETSDQIARSVAQLALYELSDDYFATFVARVANLTRDAVQAAATRNLRPQGLLAVVVGDAARVGPTLEPLGLGAPKLTAVG